MKKTTLIIMFLTIIFTLQFSNRLCAGSAIIFDAKQYYKDKGKPITYTDSFTAVDTPGQYTIHVWQGENGENMAKNGDISLNGIEIVSAKELRNGTGYITKPISLQLDNTLAVKLKGKSGVYLTVKITKEVSPTDLSINISSPSDGEIVNKESVMVLGSFHSIFNEISVVVNGKVAEVSGNNFYANNIPLIAGQNSISAMIIESGGYKAEETITIQTDTQTPPVQLSSNITSGISPLTIYFTVDTNIPHPVTTVQMDYDGNGSIDYTADNTDNISYTYTINDNGLHLAQAIVTDAIGNQYSERLAINVLSIEEMDTLLKNKWSGVVSALMDKNTQTALTYFSERSRPKYEQGFNLLMDQLPEIFSLREEFNLVSIKDNIALYENIVQENGVPRSYPVMFIKDENGFWKIKGF